MDNARWLEAIERDSEALADAAKGNLEKQVPSCPEWKVEKLVRHTADAHSWAKGMVRERATSVGRPENMPQDADVVEWFLEGSRSFVEVLRANDPSTPVWTWFPPNQTVGFWQRRMAHETSVHRWDGENAVGKASPIEPDLAADGLDEWLRVVLLARAGSGDWLKGSVHVHVTDAEGEWLVHPSPSGFTVTDGHEKADVALRGPASDLLLALMQRKDASVIEIVGDVAMAKTFMDRMTF